MQRALICASLIGVTACAPAAPVTSAGSRTTAPADLENAAGIPSALALIRNTDVASHTFPAEPAELWERLVEEFQAMELPITVFATDTRLVGSQNQRLRRIGGQPISRYFECPGTALGNTASTETVAVTVIAQLVPAANRTSDLRIVVAAISRPRGGTESRCRSTDQLERRIRQALARVRAGAG